MKMTKHNMPETMYRASRCCRILGNPTAYLVLRCLGNTRKTPTDLSQELLLSLASVSATLRQLRNLDLVRYETKGRIKEYWTKDSTVLSILSSLESWVGTMRKKRL